jgi:hypothetical protein
MLAATISVPDARICSTYRTAASAAASRAKLVALVRRALPRFLSLEPAEGKQDGADSDEDEDEVNEEERTWVSWFCGIRGNEVLVAVDAEFASDECVGGGAERH